MTALRHLIGRSPALAVLVLAASLLMKLAVPAGYMPMPGDGGFAITLCPGAAPVAEPAHAMPGMAHEAPAERDHAKPDSTCAFAGLAMPFVGTVDPIQLALAFLAIVAAALVLVPPAATRRTRHLRPLLRGPPLPA